MGPIGLTRLGPGFPAGLAAAVALLLAVAGAASAQIPLDEAAIFFEENATDGDLGIQLFWDGEPWTNVTVIGPDRRRVLSETVAA
jgi:hypothetical protein